ncbi:GNAT family N-acetyltransferase [Virgibacillus sp. JSM 102003]|uniref:GNAT family N-acetyltransferase n=1 Tax=Virgibacillus sp. JSM 102003 TaxID=1562108 RepID=UPI0035C00C59
MNPIMNIDIAKTIEQSEVDTMSSRLTAIKNIKNNPMKVEVKNFGMATAFTVKNIPGPSFNTVKGLHYTDVNLLDEIIAFYDKENIPCRFEVTPAHASSELFFKLAHRGFYQTSFHTALYSTPSLDNNDLLNSEISIRKIEKNEFDIFAEIYVKGFQMPNFVKSGVAENNRVLYDDENWKFYLASVKSEPVGIGVLFVKNGTATLAASATLPGYRNKGVHTALLIKRINEAQSMKLGLVAGQAEFGSTSQTNMQRLGMNIAYTKAIWEK